MDRLEVASRDQVQIMHGWADKDGWHPGIIQVLTEGLRDARQDLAEIRSQFSATRSQVSGFFRDLRSAALRVAWAIFSFFGTGLVAAIWAAAHNLPAIQKALSGQ